MKRFNIDFSFCIIAICFIFSPLQLDFIVILVCLTIHELGHIFFINFFKNSIYKIKVYGFGCLIDYDNIFSKYFEDILIYFGGIIFNFISLLILPDIFRKYTYLIIIINLLPIYPLDGFRIVSSTLSYCLPYKKSLYISFIISFSSLLIISIIMVTYYDYLLLFNIIYLIVLNIIEVKKTNILYSNLCLNRFLYNNPYNLKKIKFNEKIYDNLYRYHHIYFILGERIVYEKNILKLKYCK